MFAAHDNIDDHIKNQSLLGVCSAIELSWEWMLSACDNIEDHITDE
jgi:hypothetical protein